MENKEIKSEARLSLPEATSIIIGHGVGSGVLAVPFLASRNSFSEFIIIIVIAYCVNLLLHFMIAELSLNNGGAQFIKCFENELFKGKIKKVATYLAFGILGLSVLLNVSGFIAGSSAVLESWFGIPRFWGMIIYCALAALVVFFGMKIVGYAEKIAVFLMVAVIGVLFVSVVNSPIQSLPFQHVKATNVLALYSMVSFSLSAVMSVPQCVKGLNGDGKKIRLSIALGTGINILIVFIITLMTLLSCGVNVSQDGALVDLSKSIGGWVSIVGYVFSLLALSTSFWANTLNLRDIISEQTRFNKNLCWLFSSLPCLIIALTGIQSFVGFTRFAGVVQVLTGVGIIIAYNRSRKKCGGGNICGKFGTLPFQILVICGSLLSTVGSLLKVA